MAMIEAEARFFFALGVVGIGVPRVVCCCKSCPQRGANKAKGSDEASDVDKGILLA